MTLIISVILATAFFGVGCYFGSWKAPKNLSRHNCDAVPSELGEEQSSAQFSRPFAAILVYLITVALFLYATTVPRIGIDNMNLRPVYIVVVSFFLGGVAANANLLWSKNSGE